MSQSLNSRLSPIRRRARQVMWLYGLSWVIAVVFGAALLVGLIDWAVHLDDAGVRLILGLSILCAGGWVTWRYLVHPLRGSLSDIDLALRIEQRFPGFNDSFASSVQFLEGGTDPRLGSPELQARVIQQTVGQADRVNLTDVIETRGARRLVGVAVSICLTSALIVGLNQANAGIALNRLVFPFAGIAWPKTTNLRLLNADFEPLADNPPSPLRVVQSDVLTLYVENTKGNGILPDDIQMEYRFGDEEVVTERLRTITRRDDQGRVHEFGVAVLVATRGPMWFRAVGGDDRDKPMFELEVVPPPLLVDLQVTLTPPAYSRKQPKQLTPGVGHVQGLVGTRVEISARVNKSLKRASLRVRGQSSDPIELPDDGRRLKTEFTITEHGVYSYWFDLRDLQGFENPAAPRYEIRGVADLPPDIQIERPPTDQYVTAVAEVPLTLLARDDLGLKDVRLHYKLRDTQENLTEPRLLRDGRQDSERPQELVLEEVWMLAELSLAPGMRVVFHAEATDDYDLGPDHVGRSISRTLTIVSAGEKKAELLSRQSEMLDTLDRLFTAQSRARQQVGELLTQLSKVGVLRRQDIDLLKRIELEQRQISSQLLNPVDGVELRTRNMLAELKNNKIDDPEMQWRLNQLASELMLLREEYLPAVQQELTRARKAANSDAGQNSSPKEDSGQLSGSLPAKEASPEVQQPTSDEARRPDLDVNENSAQNTITHDSSEREEAASLDRARENQDAVLESLDVMREQLTRWRNRHDIMRDLDDLIAGQEQVKQDAAAVGRKTLARNVDQLAPQEEADLAKVADRQRRRADQLDEFRDKLKALEDDARSMSSADGGSLSDAQQHIDNQAIGSRMRQVVDQLRRNQVGIAANGQQQILTDLGELRDILNHRSTDDLETLVKKLKQAEAELLQLRKQQEELLNNAQQAGQLADPKMRRQELERLQKKQQTLRGEAARMSRQLRRLKAQSSSDSTSRAAERMRGAEEQLAGDSSAEAAIEQQEALDDLQQAQRELSRERQRVEERLARELLERTSGKFQAMIALQQTIIDETRRLDTEHVKRGNWSKGQLKSLTRLRENQQNLQQDAERLADKLHDAEVFALALRGASRQMHKAVVRLSKRETGEKTVAAELAAKQRLVELVAVLKPERGSGQTQGGGDGGGDDKGEPDQLTPQLSQLKMIKSLQEGLVQRTTELDEQRKTGGKLSEEDQQELEEIADEQGQLADLVRNLMRAFVEAIEVDDKTDDDKTDKLRKER